MWPHNHPARCPFLIRLPVPAMLDWADAFYQCRRPVGHTQPHDSVVLTRGERQRFAELLRVEAEGGEKP